MTDAGPAPTVLVLDGTEYVEVVESTLEHDLYVVGRMQRAGLDRDLAGGPVALPAPDAVALRAIEFIAKLQSAGVLYEVLGAAIAPRGVEWTPEVGLATAERLRTTRDPDVKSTVYQLLAHFVFAFFVGASRRFATSANASSDPDGPPDLRPSSEAPVATTSESGTTLSESSPEAIPADIAKF